MPYCFVPGCKTAYNQERKKRKAAGEPVLTLFKAPSDGRNFIKWQEAIPSPGRRFSDNDYVCELHFSEEAISRTRTSKPGNRDFQALYNDYQYKSSGQRNVLKRHAIPTIFPESTPRTGQVATIKPYVIDKEVLSKTLLTGKQAGKVLKPHHVLVKAQDINVATESSDLDNSNKRTSLSLEINQANTYFLLGTLLTFETPPLKKDASAQVINSELGYSFSTTIKTVNHLKAVTGLSSFKILNEICARVSPAYQPQVESRYFSLHDRVLLVFIKLKLSLNFGEISLLFNITTEKCKETFNEYVQYIGTALRRCILWPYKKRENAKCIIDCVNVQVQKQCPLKFMTCVSPDGLIGFVSKICGLGLSDKAVFHESGFIDKLKGSKDSIIVDEGFIIDKFCLDQSINVDRLAFAKDRVVVERVIQKIRNFQIFNDVLPWRLVSCADDMFTICCAVVNMENTLFNEIGR